MILVDAVTSFAAEVEHGVRSENYAWVPAFACIILFTELLKQVLQLKPCSRFTTPFLWIVELLEGDLLSYQRRNKSLLARAWEWNRPGQPSMMATLQAQSSQSSANKQLPSRRGKCIQRNSRRVARSSGANAKLGRAWFEHGLYMFCALLGVTVFRLLAFHLCFEPVLDVHNLSRGPLLRGVIPFNSMWQRLQTTPAGARVLLIVWPVMKHGLFPLFIQAMWLVHSCMIAMLVWTRNLLRIPGHLQEAVSLKGQLAAQPPQEVVPSTAKTRSSHTRSSKSAVPATPVAVEVGKQAAEPVNIVVKQEIHQRKPIAPAACEESPSKRAAKQQSVSSPPSPTVVAAVKPVQKVKPAPSPIKPVSHMCEDLIQGADLVVEVKLKQRSPVNAAPPVTTAGSAAKRSQPQQRIESAPSTVESAISPRDELIQPASRFESRLSRWTGRSSVLEDVQLSPPSFSKQDSLSLDSDTASDSDSTCDESLCVICLTNPRTMGFLHGTTVHACVCPECAPLVRSGDSCPMCRQPVAAVVSVF